VSSALVLNLAEPDLSRLRERAVLHGRSPEEEAKEILREALRPAAADVWAGVNALRERLAASGRSFSDSAELLREDRDR
jgi:plasmid stability protein